MADTAAAPAVEAGQAGRPQKPDEARFKADLAIAEKAHDEAQKRFNASRSKIDSARGSGRSSPGNDRFSELITDQKEIRKKQSENKTAKQGQQDKYNRNDAEIKKLIAEQKDARSRAGFKSADEIENKIEQMMRQVDSGQMKLVDEKKALAEVSGLRRQKKGFSNLDDLQKKIDEKKAENVELKKTFDNPESRAVAQKYEDNQKELDEIKAGREASGKNIEALKADRDRLYNEQQETWAAIKAVKDNYFQGRKAYKEYEDQVYEQRRERQRAEKAAYEKERRTRTAQQKLEEASELAFLDEIRTAEGLIKHFDPSYGAAEGEKEPSKFAATTQRTVDATGFKGVKVVKKDDEDFFVGSGGKKKKGKKGAATNGATPETGKLNMNIGIIEELAKVGVDPPSTQADVPSVVEKLKAKLDEWKKHQKEQTEKNVEKAKKEIERLEKDAAEAPVEVPTKGRRHDKSKKVAQKDAGANVEIPAENEYAQEKDAIKDVTEELRDAKIEDTNGEATV